MISLDTETLGIDLYHGARPFLVTICNEAGENQWWEWDVDPKTRYPMTSQSDAKEIQTCLDLADTIALQNPKFDRRALELIGVDLEWHKVRDTLTCGHVLASSQPHDLTAMTLHYLGVDIEPLEKTLVKACQEARAIARREFPDWRIAKADDPTMPSAKEETVKFDMWLPRAIAKALNYPKTHPWWTVCSAYANGDSSATIFLYKRMEQLLHEKGLYEIAMEKQKILPILARMEDRGITYNVNRLEELDNKYRRESGEAEIVCYDIADNYGAELVLPKSGNNNSLRKFIFETLETPVIKRSEKTGEPSLDKSVLDEYLGMFGPETDSYQFFRALTDKRKRDTARSYMEGYRKYALPMNDPQYTDFMVLHPSVNPNGSDTLRTSSQHPNEQNISKKEGFNLRYCFGPLPGRVWYSIDYENLELKIPAYEAGEQIMIDVFEKPDEYPYFGSYHLLNASIVYPDEFWEVASERDEFKTRYKSTLYQWIKNFGFAIQYGAQEETADRAAHRDGAYKAVKAKMPAIAELNKRCIDSANKTGYVETIPDREVCPERGYPLYCRRSSYGKISPTLPLNYHVQGTACWIMLRAMIKVQEYLDTLSDYRIIMNIHDELVFDFPANKPRNKSVINKVKSIMESVGDCVGIPLTCSVTPHPVTWSE